MTWTNVGRKFAWALIALVGLTTLAINVYTVSQVVRASTSVPWWDQWSLVRDLQDHQRGRPLWSILWAPYWGHRLVVARLLFFANARWCHLAPLTWLNLSIQFAHIALLTGLAWRLFAETSRALSVLAITVIFNLMLWPFQMENFAWGMQTMFPLVYFAATVSFVSLALAKGNHRAFFVGLCIIAGLISSYTMPNGLLVWPVLVAEAIWLKLRKRFAATLIILGALVVFSYFWHYTRPSMGMGPGGMLRDPLHAMLLLGNLLAAPLNLVSQRVGPLVGIVVLLLIAREAFREPRIAEQAFVVLLAPIAFLVLSALSIVAGRLDTRWLTGELELPERYFTMIGVFWSFVALFVLHTCWQRQRRPILLAFYGALLFYFMFGHIRFQLTRAEDWADFFCGVDATGSALLLDASDEQYLSVLWPNKSELDSFVAFLREDHLAMFREPRATWFRRRVSDLFPSAEGDRCIGAIETTTPLNGCWRVKGWAWDRKSARSLDDILLVDASGYIVGLGRGRLRHGYLPGFPVDTHAAMNSHVRFRHSEWLGYAREDVGKAWQSVTAYGVSASGLRVCRIVQ